MKHVLYSFALAAIASFAFVETGSAQVTVVEEEVTVTELIPENPIIMLRKSGIIGICLSVLVLRLFLPSIKVIPVILWL